MEKPVRQYKLLSSGLAEEENRTRNSILVPQASMLVLAVVVSCLLGATRNESIRGMILQCLLGSLFIAYIVFVTPRRLRRRLSKCWDSYILEIGPDYLFRQQADTPDIRLEFSEIKRIEHLPGRYVRVVGARKHHVIGIPESTDNFGEVLQSISGLAPTRTLQNDRVKKGAVLTALAMAAWMVMLWSASPRIVFPLAALVISWLAWIFVYMQRNPNVSHRNKRIGWMYLFLVLLCLLKVTATLGPLLRH